MSYRFVADENIPSHVVRALRRTGYDVSTVSELFKPGIGNEELAESAAKIGRIVVTRDADFTRLRSSLAARVKVIYVKLKYRPTELEQHILTQMERCVDMIKNHNLIILDEKGCHD